MVCWKDVKVNPDGAEVYNQKKRVALLDVVANAEVLLDDRAGSKGADLVARQALCTFDGGEQVVPGDLVSNATMDA